MQHLDQHTLKRALKHTLRPASALATLLSASASALAHDGHGLSGGHWHASDTLGFVVVAALAALAIWLARRG